MTVPIISVVIPVRNELDRLYHTISAICENRCTDSQLEIVIVDDASTQTSIHRFCNKLNLSVSRLETRIVRLKNRVGVPRARNWGAKIAKGKILFMTDSHVSFSKNWDRHVIDNVRENSIIAATIADTASSFKAYGCSLTVPFMGTRWNKKLKKLSKPYVQIASAAGTILYRKLFLKIGGYDPGMILYGGAEPEFSIRSWLSGARIIAAPDLTVKHRFKPKIEISQFLKGLKIFTIHNSLRFGLLYLSELGILQMIRSYVLTYPRDAQRALKLVNNSDVWERRTYLERILLHDFYWFVNRFNLRNQIGQRIL